MSIVASSLHPDGRSMVIRGAAVITMDGELGDLQQADIHILDGVIKQIGPSLQVQDAETIDASAMIAMPGFIDGHRHLWEGVIRNTLPTEDLAAYFRLVNKSFATGYGPEDAYLGTLVSALGALDSGTTTVFDWSHIQTTPAHTEATIAALRESGLRSVFGFGMPALEDQGHRWPQDLLRLQKEEFSSADQLLTLALASLSPEHVPEAMAKAHFQLARDAGLIGVHAGLQGMGEANAIERFGKVGLLGPYVNLVHCNTLSATEWSMIEDTGTSVCITPSSEMQMGQGVPPIQQALDAGVMPSLGIDVETSVPGDMWTQMRVLYALQRSDAFKLLHAGAKACGMIDCNDVLQYATIAGARAARLDRKVGSLVPGKVADIVLLRADRLNVLPLNDLKTAVVLNMDARNVDTVMVAERVVKREGHMKQLSSRPYQSRDWVFSKAAIPCRSPGHRF
ncbi:MAG: amidohydrolase [Ramlibacter sp.]|nr:amidohydrolase [Ramlibacter sp.]